MNSNRDIKGRVSFAIMEAKMIGSVRENLP
jgi:hypothetical protein